MAQLINLPGYQANALMNFAPISEAIDSNRKNALMWDSQQLKRDQMAQSASQFDRSFGLQQQASDREGAMAPLRMQQLQAQIKLAQQQGATAAQLAPLQQELMRAQAGMTRAHAELYGAQAKSAGQKDALNEALARMIGGSMPQQGQPQPQQGGPMMQPQSMPGGGDHPMQPMPMSGAQPQPQADPNLVLTQSAQPGAPQQAAQPEMVDTPMGRMTQEQAQRMAMALALAGKGDAGKMLSESANRGMPGTKATGEIQEKLMALADQRGRLSQMAQSFRPEWLTVDEQLKQRGLNMLDSFGPTRGAVSPQQRERMGEYAKFQTEAIQGLNQYIKDMTGAAMTIQEAERLSKGVPNPEKDSPTQFKSKLLASTEALDLAWARRTYMLKNGFKGGPEQFGIGIDQMRSIINKRGGEIAGELRKSGLPPDRIRSETARQIKQEFGI